MAPQLPVKSTEKHQFKFASGGFISRLAVSSCWVSVSCHKQIHTVTLFTRILIMAFKAKPALSAAGAASASSSSPASAVAALKAKAAAPVSLKESNKGLRGTRRRLSVVSDNKLIEGKASC